MKIIIVGAGITGLSLSLMLSKSHEIILLESAPQLAEIGAGVQMTPNAIRHLFNISPSLKKDLLAQAAVPGHMNIRSRHGDLLSSIHLEQMETDYGAPYILVHRAILHAILHRHAVSHGVDVRVNSKVISYDFTNGTVTLATGVTLSADLVVAADGINSGARAALPGGDHDAAATKPTGWAGYRLMASVDRIKQYPALAVLVVNPALDTNLWTGPGMSAMTYLIKDASMLNIVLSHRDDVDTALWTYDEYQREVKGMFKDWDPLLTTLLDISLPQITNYPAHYVPPSPSWIHDSGRFCMLGDAVHAMAFYLSMGVGLGVEDGVALCEALKLTGVEGLESDDEGGGAGDDYEAANTKSKTLQTKLQQALRLFQRTCKPRAEAMQRASTHAGNILHMENGWAQEIRDAGMKRCSEYWVDEEDSDDKGGGEDRGGEGQADEGSPSRKHGEQRNHITSSNNCTKTGTTTGLTVDGTQRAWTGADSLHHAGGLPQAERLYHGKRKYLYGMADRDTRDWCYGYDVRDVLRSEWEEMRREMAGKQGIKEEVSI